MLSFVLSITLQDYNQLFLKRQGGNGPITSGSGTTTPPSKCDGQDDLGCYQVRLYYDWFLIPGSCKCWKNDFFDQYTKKKWSSTPNEYAIEYPYILSCDNLTLPGYITDQIR